MEGRGSKNRGGSTKRFDPIFFVVFSIITDNEAAEQRI
jgi:hypothetical protein